MVLSCKIYGFGIMIDETQININQNFFSHNLSNNNNVTFFLIIHLGGYFSFSSISRSEESSLKKNVCSANFQIYFMKCMWLT